MKLLSVLTLLALLTTSSLKITTIHTSNDGLPSNQVRSLYYDMEANSLWAGTGNGATQFKNSTWQVDKRKINPVINGVSTIFKDSKKNVWFGGLNEFHVASGMEYQTYSIVDDLGINGRVVFSFHEDQDQKIWAATTGGVSVFDGTSWTPLSEGLKHPVVHDIKQDHQSKYWFATRKGGLNIYDGKDWNYLYPEKNCRKILKDGQNMWVGTSEGIIKYNGDTWKVFEEGRTILPMFKGAKGYIWCIADGTDIIRIDQNGKLISYENPTNGQAGEIYDLTQDHKGSVWAGTDSGIFVFH